jgi:hypothetical protein
VLGNLNFPALLNLSSSGPLGLGSYEKELKDDCERKNKKKRLEG